MLHKLAAVPAPVLVDTPHGTGEDILAALSLARVVVVPTGAGEPSRFALVRALEILAELAPQAKIAVFLNNWRSTVTEHQAVDVGLMKEAPKRGYSYLGPLGTGVGIERVISKGADPMQSGASAHQVRRILASLETLLEEA